MDNLNFLNNFKKKVEKLELKISEGKVLSVKNGVVVAHIVGVEIGSICTLISNSNKDNIKCEVIGFDDKEAYLMPFSSINGISIGQKVIYSYESSEIKISNSILGRIIDGSGNPIDNLGAYSREDDIFPYQSSKNPLDRETINEVLSSGIKSIDSFVTIGKGQRLSIVAGAGVGKSTLFEQIISHADSDINVIALIGERGREASDFVEKLKENGSLKKTVVIVVTSDQSPIMKIRGAFLATSIAEYFSDKSKDVLLMMDSLTRFSMAQREIGLLRGEPPTSKGYPPSVFSQLPKLLERAGKFKNKGSITGLYTVLVESNDLDDPIADAVKSFADGHIVLTRELAELGHFPAVDILSSTSRVISLISDKEHINNARELKRLYAKHREAKDLINIGAYASGADPDIDRSIEIMPKLNNFLRQVDGEKNNYDFSRIEIAKIVGE